MANFFDDNDDILFQFQNLDLDEIIKFRENDFKEKDESLYAPENIEDAKDNYMKVLSVAGQIAAFREV